MTEAPFIKSFLRIASQQCSYDAAKKAEFHARAEKVLLRLAEALGEVDLRLRHRNGGPEVSGEVILQTPSVYVEFAAGTNVFLWRPVYGLNDKVGGPSRWTPYSSLERMETLAATMKIVSQRMRK